MKFSRVMPDFGKHVAIKLTKRQAETLWMCLHGHWARGNDDEPIIRLMQIQRRLEKAAQALATGEKT